MSIRSSWALLAVPIAALMACPAVANGVPEFLLDGTDAGASIAVTMSEDGAPTPFAIDPLLTAQDSDGDTNLIVWSVSSPATSGTAMVSGMGATPSTFTYAPRDDFNGSDSFEVTITDSDMLTDSITVNVTVEPVNDAPNLTGVLGFGGKWGSTGTGDGQFTAPVAIAADSSGNVYAVENFSSRVQKFASDGTFTMSWGSAGTGDGQFSGSWGIAVDASDNVYLSDISNDRVQKFDSSGNFLLAFGSSGSGDGEFSGPSGIAVAPSGHIYVADQSNHNVQKFDSNGGFLLRWGGSGTGSGQFIAPVDIALDTSENVYVSDHNNHRIQVFDSDGNFLRQIGSNGNGDGEFSGPWGVEIGPNDTLYVADLNNNRFQSFDLMGNYLSQLGSSGTQDGEFRFPIGIAVNAMGRIYVAEYSGNRIQYFGRSTIGESVDVTMDEDGTPTAFSLPLSAADAEGDTITWSIASDASHGAADVSGTGTSKMISYVPDADYNGMDSFDVHIDDGNDGTDTVTVNVTLNPQNDLPVITQGDSALMVTMDEDGSPTAFAAPDLAATDVDDDTLTWSVSSNATDGTATVSGMGASPSTFTYAPDADFNGMDSFTIQVSDGNGGTDTIAVNVTVDPQPEAPAVTTNTGATVSEGGTVILLASMLETSDVDSAAGELTYTVTDGPTDGMLVLVSDTDTAITSFTQADINSTQVVFVHDGAENAMASFDFSVSDGATAPATGTFDITVTPVDDIPTLHTSEESSTFTEDGDAIIVDAAIEVVDPDGGPMIEAARVAIGGGYASGQDTLAFTAMHGITGSFNASIGVLSLEGAATAMQYQDVLRSVVFSTSGTNDTQRSVTFSLGDAVAFVDNGHFYRFETSAGISWTDAKNAAAALRYFGLEGYLTTITSAAENTFVVDKLEGQGWMGATDESVEGIWRWVTGPEGLEDGGAGRHFYTGDGNGSPVGGAYDNWANVEPNDFGSGEDYAHFLSNGQWNDYPLSLGSITGYVVEFGGLPEGVTLHLVDTKAVDVVLVNDAPVIAQGDGPLTVTMDEDGTPTAFIAPTVSATDEEGDMLTWSVSSAASNGTAAASGTGSSPASITYTPNANFNGSDNFTLQVDDGNGGVDTIVIDVTVNPQNDVPVISQGDGPLSVMMDEDGVPTAFEAPALTVDDPDDDTLTWSVVVAASNGTATVSGTGDSPAVHTYTPNADFNGTDSYTVEVSDGNGGTDSVVVTVAVASQNDAPVIGQGDGPLTVTLDEDGAPTAFVAPAVDAADVESDLLTWSLASPATNGTATVSGMGEVPTTFTYTPAADFNGTDAFTIQVADGNGGTDTIAVAVTVTAQPDAPVISQGDGPLSVTLDEDGSPTAFVAPALDATDADGDELSWSVSSDASNGTAAVGGTGAVPTTFTYTPNANFNGSDSFTLQVDDGNGGTDTIAVAVTVTAQPDAPVISQGDGPLSVTLDEDGSPTAFAAPALDATDADGDELSWSLSADASNGTAAVGGTGAVPTTFTYTPAADFNGADAFTIQVADGNGGTDTIVVNVTVAPVNDAPVLAAIGPQTVEEGSTLSFSLTSTDIEGDALTFDAAELPDGAVFDTETATFSWTPGFEQAGVFNDVLFRVTDDGTPPLTDTETISITVGDVNRPPVLDALENQDVAENSTLRFTVTGTDPDGDRLTFAATNLPEGATFDPATATFRWTPTLDDAGVYPDVTFSVSDDGTPVEMDHQRITITVGDVNRMPELDPIGDRQVDEGMALSFMVTATDADGDSLTYSASGLPEGASFDAETQAFAWTPGFEAMGTYDVTFTATDDGAPVASDSETIAITVGDVNRAPVLDTVGDRDVAEGAALSFTLSGSDPDGDDVTFAATDLPEGATFDEATATFAWTPGYEATGTYDVTFSVADDGAPGLSASETVSITVTDTNRAPVLDAVGDREVSEGEMLTFTLTGSDPDGDTLTFGAADLPAGASIDATSGAFTWRPASGDAGSYMVTLTVMDDGQPALSAEETIAITVAESGDLAELLLAGFGGADTNSDGLISREESTLLYPGLTAQQFEMLDTNSDGYLTEPELRGGAPVGGCFGTGPNDFFLIGLVVYLLAVWEKVMNMSARFFGFVADRPESDEEDK